MRIFTSWGWLVDDEEEKHEVWGAGSVCARAGTLGGFLCLTSLLRKSLEICGCGPSSMLIPPAMWRAGQLCKGSVLGCSLNPAGECQHWELFGMYIEWKHPVSFKNDGEEKPLRAKRLHLRIFWEIKWLSRRQRWFGKCFVRCCWWKGAGLAGAVCSQQGCMGRKLE